MNGKTTEGLYRMYLDTALIIPELSSRKEKWVSTFSQDENKSYN
jgi:hypothetical protein